MKGRVKWQRWNGGRVELPVTRTDKKRERERDSCILYRLVGVSGRERILWGDNPQLNYILAWCQEWKKSFQQTHPIWGGEFSQYSIHLQPREQVLPKFAYLRQIHMLGMWCEYVKKKLYARKLQEHGNGSEGQQPILFEVTLCQSFGSRTISLQVHISQMKKKENLVCNGDPLSPTRPQDAKRITM